MTSVNRISSVILRLAGPADIQRWSSGEVTNPGTVDPVTGRPVPGGLFCEKIFGPLKFDPLGDQRELSDQVRGKVVREFHPSILAEGTLDILPGGQGIEPRRERMGHIKLHLPVRHPWLAEPIRIVLGMSAVDLEDVTYYRSHVVLSSGEPSLTVGQILSPEETHRIATEYGGTVRTGTGAAAIAMLLEGISLDDRAAALRADIEGLSGPARRKRIEDLRLIESLKTSGIRPAWMILKILPVIPPEVRPIVRSEGGEVSASGLNSAYARIIERNNRLKELMELGSPGAMSAEAGRALQQAVDRLFGGYPHENGTTLAYQLFDRREGRLAGNQRFGKRVDYSGRSVIVSGPHLRLDECGLPKEMAIELFKPFLIHKLVEEGYAATRESALRQIKAGRDHVWDVLEDVAKERWVLLNRAPTINYLGIQAFKPVLTDHKAIELHPLVCMAYNADFDGDQMAVHIPVTSASQEEARSLMKSGLHILSAGSGEPIVGPTQDMVLGCAYLTKFKAGAKGEGRSFDNPLRAKKAYRLGEVDLHARIKVKAHGGDQETTVGRLFFNEVLPEGHPYVDEEMDKTKLSQLIANAYRRFGGNTTAEMLDRINHLGFRWATRYTASFGKDVFPVLKPQGERSIEEWGDELLEKLKQDQEGFNPMAMMLFSGARGNRQQVTSLGAAAGMMTWPSEEPVLHPVETPRKEGLAPLDYFCSTYGARRGLAGTVLKMSHAGWMARSLFNLTQTIIISEEDCRITAEDRSPFTCTSEHGLCARCYRRDVRTGKPVEVGTAVGPLAAYALTEPSTKLTLINYYRTSPEGEVEVQPSGLIRLLHLIKLNDEATKTELQAILSERGEQGLRSYWIEEVDKVFREQGVVIDRVHFEVILSQMLQTVEVEDPGDTAFLTGEWVSKRALRRANRNVEAQGQRPASGRTVLLSADEAVVQAVQAGEGFLSTGGRSFDILPRLALSGAEDPLRGLEANVILGKRIPAGTGHIS